jgi:uncharacterized repeat protein (TIGR03803 family)
MALCLQEILAEIPTAAGGNPGLKAFRNPNVSVARATKESRLSLWKTIFFLCVFCAVGAISSPGQTLTTLVNFDGANGANLYMVSLVQGTDGNFYGTTAGGGANGDGTVFKMTAGGTLTTLHSFDRTDGANPYAGLVLATNGNFYGTTIAGGANGEGTVFKMTAGGTLTTLHSFDGTDGSEPYAGLVQATNGNFYGTTFSSGANGDGTIFKITPGGTLTTLFSFDGPHGASPIAGLVQATNGNFYGVASGGGANGDGTVFEITPGGKLTTLLNFDGADGAGPYGGLVQAANGSFYGTTGGGGTNPDGTVFEITPGGTLTHLYSFCSQTSCADGRTPTAGLVLATDGNFYGTTGGGGANGDGTVFEITPGGTLTTLHSFDGPDGETPYGGLVQGTNGNFYGTTDVGGANGDGTVFSLSVGLGPFVETLPTSGKVGAAVIILGTNLTGATSVTFNGLAATFTVVSGSEIKTTVPSGATTGQVKVTTPSGTLTSNVNFLVS